MEPNDDPKTEAFKNSSDMVLKTYLHNINQP